MQQLQDLLLLAVPINYMRAEAFCKIILHTAKCKILILCIRNINLPRNNDMHCHPRSFWNNKNNIQIIR